MTTTKTSNWYEAEEAKDELRPILERCSTVYAVVHHVSRSGMQRRIDFYVNDWRGLDGKLHTAPDLRRISHLVAKVLGRRLTDDGVVVSSEVTTVIWEARRDLGFGDSSFDFEIRYL